MSRYISKKLRNLVTSRADYRCEYCRVFERHSFLEFQIEHILSIKHGGQSVEANLAYACCVCNYSKGSDIATFVGDSNNPIRFFNPRTDAWNDHFDIQSTGNIIATSPIGTATVKILNLNHPDAVLERSVMIQKGIF